MFTTNSTRLDGQDRTVARIGVRLDAATRADLEAVAHRYSIPLSEAARQAIRGALTREMKRNGKRSASTRRPTRNRRIKVRA